METNNILFILDMYYYFFLVYSSVFLFISFSLIFKQKLISYKIFGALCLFTAHSSFLNFLMTSNILVNFPVPYSASSPLQYLYGPLCYFFVLYSLDNKRIFSKKDLFHLLPLVFNFVELFPTFFSFVEPKLELLNISIYLIYSFFSIKLILPLFYNEDNALFLKNRMFFSWLIFDTCSKALLIIVALLLVMFSNSLPFSRSVSNLFFCLGMSVSVLYFVLSPILMPGIQLLSVKEVDNLISLNRKKSDKIKKAEQLISEQLTDFMDINKPYLNKISINDIAVPMKISSAKLASIINENYNQSFTDFINSYRLKSIDRQVSEKKHLKYSFEYMAYDAGFSSKNAFYGAFKKLRNTTPKKFYGIDD